MPSRPSPDSGARLWTRRAALAAGVAAAGVTGAAIVTGMGGSGGTGGAASDGSGAPSPGATAVSEAGGEPGRLWIIGDSLSAGWDATTRANGYTALLAEQLAGSYDVEVAAVPGDTLAEAVSRHAVPPGLNVAVVELGTNDLAGGTDPEAFIDSYEQLLGEIRVGSPDATLLCLGAWYTAREPAVAFLDRLIRSACTAHGGRFLELSGLYDDATHRGPAGQDVVRGLSDEFHPNDAGHRSLAELVAGELDGQ